MTALKHSTSEIAFYCNRTVPLRKTHAWEKIHFDNRTVLLLLLIQPTNLSINLFFQKNSVNNKVNVQKLEKAARKATP